MPVIFFAIALPGVAERLARVSAGNKVNSSMFIRFECLYVVVDWHAWEVLLQHLRGVWVDLAEAHRFDPAHHPCSEGEAANAAKQIKMPNKRMMGTGHYFVVVSEPVARPISLALAKDFLRCGDGG
jgi:hypothetical protein